MTCHYFYLFITIANGHIQAWLRMLQATQPSIKWVWKPSSLISMKKRTDRNQCLIPWNYQTVNACSTSINYNKKTTILDGYPQGGLTVIVCSYENGMSVFLIFYRWRAVEMWQFFLTKVFSKYISYFLNTFL